MTTSSKIEVEVEMKTPAEKLWSNIKQFATVFPKAIPQTYARIEVLEGDGESVGSVLASTYVQPDSDSVVKATKQRIEGVDEEKRILSYSVLEEGIFSYCTNFKGSFRVISKSDGDGALLIYSAEFDKANDHIDAQPSVEEISTTFTVLALQSLDAYLLTA